MLFPRSPPSCTGGRTSDDWPLARALAASSFSSSEGSLAVKSQGTELQNFALRLQLQSFWVQSCLKKSHAVYIPSLVLVFFRLLWLTFHRKREEELRVFCCSASVWGPSSLKPQPNPNLATSAGLLSGYDLLRLITTQSPSMWIKQGSLHFFHKHHLK